MAGCDRPGSNPSQDGEGSHTSGPQESDTKSDDGGRVISFRLPATLHRTSISGEMASLRVEESMNERTRSPMAVATDKEQAEPGWRGSHGERPGGVRHDVGRRRASPLIPTG